MIKILIIKDRFKMYVYKDNELIKIYPVAIGKPETPTPEGKMFVINKAMNPGGAYGSMWIGLSIPHIGIHGTNNPSSIGTAASHGCIRMNNEDVAELAKIVPIGTEVVIIPSSEW